MSPDYKFYVPPEDEANFLKAIEDAKLPGVRLLDKKTPNHERLDLVKELIDNLGQKVEFVIEQANNSNPEFTQMINARYISMFEKAGEKDKYIYKKPVNFRDPMFLPQSLNRLFELFIKPTTISIEDIADEHTFKFMHWQSKGYPLSPLDIETLIDAFGLNGQEPLEPKEIAKKNNISLQTTRLRTNTALLHLIRDKEIRSISKDFEVNTEVTWTTKDIST